MEVYIEVTSGNRVDKQGKWEAGFVASRVWGNHSSYGRIWLVDLSNSVGQQKTELHYLGISRNCVQSL